MSLDVDIDVRLARLEERSRHVQINDAGLGTNLFVMYPPLFVTRLVILTLYISMRTNFLNSMGH